MPPDRSGNWFATHTGGMGRALSHPNYRLYQTGNVFSLLGTWIQRISVGWLAWEMTHSPLWLGLIAAGELAPSILMGPIGGAFADRVNRLNILRVMQALLFVVATAMAAFTLTGLITPGLLLALNFAAGFVVSFGQPARLSMVRSLVPPADLPAAVATNSILWNVARFIGPAIAGVIIVQVGVGYAFIFNAVTYLVFLWALNRLNLPRVAVSARKPTSILTDMREGVAYVAGHPGLGPILLLLMVNAITVRPYVELLPGFADVIYGRGVDGLAALTAAIGAGAIIAGTWVGSHVGFKGLTRLAVDGVLVLALSAILFAATESFWVGLIGAALSGAAMVVSSVAMQSLIQNATDASVLSRVLSLYGLSFRAGPAAGALAMGAASEFMGLQTPVIIGSMLCLLGWFWARIRMRRIAAALEGET
ncbi:MAG: MFS transporter [Alphaproteobacteria bacterium]